MISKWTIPSLASFKNSSKQNNQKHVASTIQNAKLAVANCHEKFKEGP